MKNIIMLFTLTLIISIMGCKREVEIEKNGVVSKIEVEKKEIVSESQMIEQEMEVQTITQKESCTHMGMCCKCGFTLNMEHECSCGIWRNCPGTHEVTYQTQEYMFRKMYQFRSPSGENYSHKSPVYKGQRRHATGSTECH